MKWTPPAAAAIGAGIGTAIATFAVGAELRASGMGLLELHLSSVTVWVVDSLPLMLAVAGYGVGDRRGVRRAPKVRVVTQTPAPAAPRRDLPRPAPVPPPGPPPATPAGVTRTVAPAQMPRYSSRPPTPAPAPDRVQAMSPPELPPTLRDAIVLYVDGHVEGPTVAAALEAAGLELHHVRDALSGAVVVEETRLSVALIDSGDPDGATLVAELQEAGVPTVAIGARAAGPGVLRPLQPQRVVDALAVALRG